MAVGYTKTAICTPKVSSSTFRATAANSLLSMISTLLVFDKASAAV